MRFNLVQGSVMFGAAITLSESHALGSYQGLSVVSSLGATNGRITYRVYANFNDANDYLTFVFGSPSYGDMTIRSTDLAGVGPGSSFFNPVTSHGTAPTPVDCYGGFNPTGSAIPPIANAPWDTFYTIGVDSGGTGTGPNGTNETGNQYMPENFVPGTSFTHDNAGWYTAGPVEQGRAGWLGDGDAQLRVLMIQLTVSSTSGVRGTVNIAGVNNIPLAGGESFIAAQQTFAAVPGPGALVLIGTGLLGLTGRRRDQVRPQRRSIQP